MRKEVLYAVIFGVILGGVILYGINLANNSTKISTEQNQPTPSIQNTTPTPTTDAIKIFDLLVPQDHAVITEKSTTVRGIAEPGATVAIISELNDLIVDVSPEGTFSAQIDLSSGVNKIKVVQAGRNETTNSISITVIQTDTIPE